MSLHEQHIIFKSTEQVYGLNIAHVQEIIKMKEICETPNSNRQYLKGVINVRGIIIPVISLSQRFHRIQKETTNASRIIITKTNEQFVGIIVDEIVKVESLEIHPLPETVHEEIKETCVGMSYMGDLIIPILQLTSILQIGSEKN